MVVEVEVVVVVAVVIPQFMHAQVNTTILILLIKAHIEITPCRFFGLLGATLIFRGFCMT